MADGDGSIWAAGQDRGSGGHRLLQLVDISPPKGRLGDHPERQSSDYCGEVDALTAGRSAPQPSRQGIGSIHCDPVKTLVVLGRRIEK
jgi:hypothetical protein